PHDELQEIITASQGLMYPSETDAPFEPFCWTAQGGGSARNQIAAHAGKGRPIQEVSVEDFFAELDDSEDADCFHTLRQALETHLMGLKIFRLGQIKIDVYLIGQTRSGDWAGLHTLSVET
ncbi:MAG TPA: nuclease A inhibitor family protein, partial [Tepidisphaeraceae bacterium]|nr:nuclease A inhibitor family protein [Tepidisphaeraceae bacterium]